MKKIITPSLFNLLLLALLIISVAGCAHNKPVASAAPKPVFSEPNEYSAYLFSVGNVLYYNEDLNGSAMAYRVALRYDPDSKTIKKALFNTMLLRAIRSEINPVDFGNYVDTLLVQDVMDKQMLEQTFDLLVKTENYQQAKNILDIYFKSYESARAYTAMFYLEQSLNNKTNTGLLDKAYKLAGNDADFLNSLGLLYSAFDASKAESIWLQSRKFDPGLQSAQYLRELYSKQNNSAKMHKLWASFILPDDKDKLTQLLNGAFESGDFNALILLSDVILISNNPQYILQLAQSCWYESNNPLFEQSRDKLLTMGLDKQQLQLVYFYDALYNLRKDNTQAALQQIARLDGKSALDELAGIYKVTILTEGEKKDTTRVEIARATLRKAIEPATPAQLAPPVKAYLLAEIDSLTAENDVNIPDNLSYACVKWFYDNNRRTYDTYFWLAQYYYRNKDDNRQKAILKEALAEYPNSAEMLNWLGYSYVLSGENLDEAEAYISRALQIDEDNPYYLDSLAWLFYLKGDFQEALSLMDIPSRLEKMPAEVAFHLGSIYKAVHDTEKATYYFKLTIEINDDPDYVAKAKAELESMQKM